MKKVVYYILKKKSLSEDRHIQWDEQTIEEHDKLRGQYPKINEPKTPYNFDNVYHFYLG